MGHITEVSPLYAWEGEGWIEAVMSIPAREAPSLPLRLQGTLWLSVSTSRRASVLWASGGRVCLSYDETNRKARNVLPETDFKRLYMQIK